MTERRTGVHHFFVEGSRIHDGVVEITGEDAHHAGRVLRLRSGEVITVADGSGRVVEAVVDRVGSSVVADIIAEHVALPPKPVVTLYQAVVKAQRMDDVIEKAVEVGVHRIVPFIAERTIVRWDGGKRRTAVVRWQAIARAAGKQSRSPFLSSVHPIVEGPEAALYSGSPVIVLDETSVLPLRDALPPSPPEEIVIAVGPEGGFTPIEQDRLREGGAKLVTLGPRILRTETAGPVAAAIVAYSYGTLG